MSTNYARGARYERECIKQLISQGYLVANRSAGSRGIFDVFAIAKDHALFIQVKSTPEDARHAVDSIIGAGLPKADNIRYQVWEKTGRGKWTIYHL